jgi:hypothetical protein
MKKRTKKHAVIFDDSFENVNMTPRMAERLRLLSERPVVVIGKRITNS